MKAPLKMYKLKPNVVHDFSIEIPKCMYRLGNIHEPKKVDDGPGEQVPAPKEKLDIFDQNCPEKIPGMAELETRQNRILEQLAQLKQQISSLKSDLNIPTTSQDTITGCFQVGLKKTSLPESLVITANPNQPPYSLELLQLLLQNEISLIVTSYLHSSVTTLPIPALQLQKTLENFVVSSNAPKLKVCLIWKMIDSSVDLMLTPSGVSGEVNLLRYLTRLTNTQLSYDSSKDALEIESLLDQCYLLVRSRTKSERANILQLFNKSLAKSTWLLGRNQASVVDVAAYSAIKQCGSSKELNANLNKWFQNCASLVNTKC